MKNNFKEIFGVSVPGKPLFLKRPRAFKRRGSTGSTINFCDTQKPQKNDFAFTVLSLLKTKGFCPLECFIHVQMEFFLPIPKSFSKKKKKEMEGTIHGKKPDLSNLIKFVEDALNDVIWKDDNIISSISASKFYSNEPKTVIKVFTKK